MAGFKVIIEGATVVCDDPADVFRLLRFNTDSAAPLSHIEQPPTADRKEREKPNGNGIYSRAHKQRKDLQRTLKFLEIIANGGGGGVTGATVVDGLGIKDGRGLGGALVRIKRVLKEQGFDHKDVYRMSGERDQRRWRPRNRLPEAVAGLNAAIAKEN